MIIELAKNYGFCFGVKRAIKTFIADGTISYEICPDCGEKLIYENGCTLCKNCGYSKCG